MQEGQEVGAVLQPGQQAVSGLGPVVEAIGEPRTAWLWLREPNPELGGAAPLARLKAGATDKVVEVARSNFAGA